MYFKKQEKKCAGGHKHLAIRPPPPCPVESTSLTSSPSRSLLRLSVRLNARFFPSLQRRQIQDGDKRDKIPFSMTEQTLLFSAIEGMAMHLHTRTSFHFLSWRQCLPSWFQEICQSVRPALSLSLSVFQDWGILGFDNLEKWGILLFWGFNCESVVILVDQQMWFLTCVSSKWNF